MDQKGEAIGMSRLDSGFKFLPPPSSPPPVPSGMVVKTFELDLRAAIGGEGGTRLVWQPIETLETGTTVAFEALLRWRHARVGPIPPAEIIPFAEASDLILDIDAWALRTACRSAATWRPRLRVAVNVSPASLRGGRMARIVEEALNETGLDPARLELEVTEHAELDLTLPIISELQSIRSMSVGLSLDDLGAGYASLQRLNLFPFDKVKLDRSLVSGLGRNQRTEIIARNLLRMCTELGVATCAEGVDAPAQVEFLRQHDCTEVQGYMIGRPGPLDAGIVSAGFDPARDQPAGIRA